MRFDHPQVGRMAECLMRELVISRGLSGYEALYQFDADCDPASGRAGMMREILYWSAKTTAVSFRLFTLPVKFILGERNA